MPLVLDGVFAEDGVGGLRFHETGPPSDEEMDAVLVVTVRRLRRLLTRRGVVDEADGAGGPDAWSHDDPVLARIASASVAGVWPSARAPEPRRASLVVPARDRARLERHAGTRCGLLSRMTASS